jgi:hypothetical protein
MPLVIHYFQTHRSSLYGQEFIPYRHSLIYVGVNFRAPLHSSKVYIRWIRPTTYYIYITYIVYVCWDTKQTLKTIVGTVKILMEIMQIRLWESIHNKVNGSLSLCKPVSVCGCLYSSTTRLTEFSFLQGKLSNCISRYVSTSCEDTGCSFVRFKTLRILVVKLELKRPKYILMNLTVPRKSHVIQSILSKSSGSNADKAKMVTNKCPYIWVKIPLNHPILYKNHLTL